MKIATVCCPLVAVGISGAIVGVESARAKFCTAEGIRLQAQATALEQAMKAMSGLAHTPRFATAAASLQEQPEFLKQLRGYAGQRKIQIVRWSDAPVIESSGSASANTPTARPSGVSAVVSQVDIKGSYNGSRHFLYDLLRSPRLLTLNDVKYSRGEHGIHSTTFSVTRYVTSQPNTKN